MLENLQYLIFSEKPPENDFQIVGLSDCMFLKKKVHFSVSSMIGVVCVWGGGGGGGAHVCTEIIRFQPEA